MDDLDGVDFVAPAPSFEADFWAMCGEYQRAGERYEPSWLLPPGRDFGAYLRRLDEVREGIAPLPGGVPMSVFWLVRGGVILGTCYFRWALTDLLRIEGGHIGYKVRPSQRRKGYGTHILERALGLAREQEMDRVLVTCNTSNVPSARIIEKNGGRFSGEGRSPHTGKLVSRYWIDLYPTGASRKEIRQ